MANAYLNVKIPRFFGLARLKKSIQDNTLFFFFFFFCY